MFLVSDVSRNYLVDGANSALNKFNQYLMKNNAYHILRVGVGITFAWIGILIFQSPESWGGLIMPWAAGLLPFSVEHAMISTAILDIIIGFVLLIDVFTWLAAGIGSIHLVIVLITAGINAITVRDIGLLAATLALVAHTLPQIKSHTN